MRRLRELRAKLSKLKCEIVEGESESKSEGMRSNKFRKDFRDTPIRQSA